MNALEVGVVGSRGGGVGQDETSKSGIAEQPNRADVALEEGVEGHEVAIDGASPGSVLA